MEKRHPQPFLKGLDPFVWAVLGGNCFLYSLNVVTAFNIGEGVKGPDYHHLADHKAAADLLRECTAEGDLVLVKGSRAARMERIIEEVKKP